MDKSEDFYRTLCSLETLRSGQKGFFREFSDRATSVVGDTWTSKIFRRIDNDEDRVRAVFTDGKIKDVVLETLQRVTRLYRDKDAAVSREKRLEGFRAAAAGEREKALLLFSQAVLRAPSTGKCTAVDRGFGLALALIARAEIFVASGEYDLALEDFGLLDESDLPDDLKAEVVRKKKECEDRSRANEKSVILAKEVSGKSGPRPRAGERPFASQDGLPRPTGGENRRLPGASALIGIEETANAGKRAVALQRINPGDVLVVESPLVGCLLPEFFGTHCQHCFGRLRAPVGCPECSSVAFCGKRCRDVATSSYHKYECKVLALLIGSGMSVLSALALRMVTREGRERCLEIRRALVQRNSKDGAKEVDVRDAETTEAGQSSGNGRTKPGRSARRRMRKKLSRGEEETRRSEGIAGNDEPFDLRAYELVTHDGRRSPEDFLERTLMAAFLLRCLQRVDFFERPSKDHEPPGNEEIEIGALLLRNLQLLQFNAHEFFETRLGSEHRFRGSKAVYLGVALYPTVARFNHDCYPAVTRYFVGRNIVIRAIRVLEPGDAVAENYGPIFTKRTLEERRRTLAGRYWFRCECRACRENWPCFDDLTNDHARLRCPTKGCRGTHRRPAGTASWPATMTCPSCRRTTETAKMLKALRECERLYARGFAKMEEERTDEAVEILIEAATKFHRTARAPHRDAHLAEIALGSCMADSGNTWKANSLVSG